MPTYDGAVALRAQNSRAGQPEPIPANGVSLTSSRLGVPSYDLRASTMAYNDVQQPLIDPQTGQVLVDPEGVP